MHKARKPCAFFCQETCCLLCVLEIYRAVLRALNNIVYIPIITLLGRDEYDNTEVIVVVVACVSVVVVWLQLEGKLTRSCLASLDNAERVA